MRLLAKVSYDGTLFVGWQIQPNGRSVQEEIENVISKILNVKTKIYGSGRTDAMVHALGQTFHFDVNKDNIDIGKLRYSINSLLPEDIHINSLVKVDTNFHARFMAKNKTYEYILNEGEYNVFERNYVFQFLRPLDINKMIEASKLFVGKHCFKGFTAKEEDEDNFIREIYSFEIFEENNKVHFIISGNGFMRYMVRNIVGTLIEIGLEKIDKSYIENIFKNTNLKTQYRSKANGLYLVKVDY